MTLAHSCCGLSCLEQTIGRMILNKNGDIIDIFYSVDATSPSRRSGKYCNHSRKNPNARMRTTLVDGLPRVYIEALKNIKKGEQVFYDYGER
jgi:SET domain-containing protein